uniref:DUF58 domain-containing protein n=1 Tax=Caldiarchaeum subterraneum TaxID=311458 RepID=E6NA68_CALS0|nr:hypothetical protein HGMM_F32B02C19 [Candidatus Caldarchaeum subterraneum]
MKLTAQGYKTLVTMFIIVFFASTVSVYRALSLSIYIVGVFIPLYCFFAASSLRMLSQNDFLFSRHVKRALLRKGEHAEVRVKVENKSGRRVRVRVLERIEGLKVVEGSVQAERNLAPDELLELSYTVTSHGRGIGLLGPLVVHVLDDYGMVYKEFTLGEEVKIVFTEHIIGQPKLSDAVKTVFPTPYAGTGSSHEYGVDDIFREITRYEEGQPLKAVDWRRTARENGEIFVRRFDKQNRLRICLVLDYSHGNILGNPSLLDSVVGAVSTLASSVLERGDSVTIVVPGAREGVVKATGLRDYFRLLTFLSTVAPVSSYRIVDWLEYLHGFDAVFMVGRFANLDEASLKTVAEKVRMYGGVLYLLVPTLENVTRPVKALEVLEQARVQRLRKIYGHVYLVRQTDLLNYLVHLHRSLRMMI